ncbi:hypothetical protein [Oceanospirillum sediminis]|uniref:DUF4214 domain-containing protein n=1 Tax=Oceanospirillum sediminis TaxID=2760088 RepID=A0A839IT19_9GAMM|nr:hypothetical protein [Oceanospirillum sediminis]MBB1488118.1 hypothetical protein [Oceanospirillum sediminis]
MTDYDDDNTSGAPVTVRFTSTDSGSSSGDSKSGNSDSKSGGNDSVAGGADSGRIINGDSGLNTVTYASFYLADVELAALNNTDSKTGNITSGWTVDYQVSDTNSKSGETTIRTETDQLFDIERLSFKDTSVALDLDIDDNAGAALALFFAAFDQAPDQESFGRWIAESDRLNPNNGDAKIDELAQSMINHYVPGGVSNDVLVGLLFKNVVGVEASAQDLALYSGLIDSGEHTQASLFAMAAQLELNTNQVDDLTTTGLQYTPDDSKIG